MRLLLDTHVLLWALNGDRRLGTDTRRLLEHRDNEVWFSAVNVWEMAIKVSLGRDDLNVDPDAVAELARECGFEEFPIHSRHASATTRLPPLHADPFDRLLIAQAHTENLTLLTIDAAVLAYGPVTLRA
ncbi:MAG: type II toxin-antitoxin system VapC family toxin [Burkholderiales bacterium]